MTMVQGTISIDASGNESYVPSSGPNAVREVYEVMIASLDLSAVTGTDLQEAKEKVAAMARAVATIIPHIQANAQASGSGVVATAIPVQVAIATGTGATTAPGTSTVTVPTGGIT